MRTASMSNKTLMRTPQGFKELSIQMTFSTINWPDWILKQTHETKSLFTQSNFQLFNKYNGK